MKTFWECKTDDSRLSHFRDQVMQSLYLYSNVARPLVYIVLQISIDTRWVYMRACIYYVRFYSPPPMIMNYFWNLYDFCKANKENWSASPWQHYFYSLQFDLLVFWTCFFEIYPIDWHHSMHITYIQCGERRFINHSTVSVRLNLQCQTFYAWG